MHLKKTTHITLKIVIICMLPFVVITLLTSKTLLFSSFRSFVVLTGSMSPIIPQGSIIYTLKQNRYEKNDIIAFQKGNTTVTHRIIETLPNSSFKTQGDANNTPDKDLITKDKILGKEIFTIPYVGNFFLFLKTLPGFVLFIIIPTVAFIAFELWNIKNEMEKEIMKKLKMNP